MGDNLRDHIFASRKIPVALLLCAIFIVGFSALRFQAPEMLNQTKVMTDFDAFHVAGTMAREGQAALAYDAAATFAAQERITGTQSFMPWTYPPPFTFLMEQFARLPVGVAFAIFTSLTFLFWLTVMHRIAGPYLPGALIAVIPTIVINLRTGQNGFLIAGLIGTVLLMHRKGQVGAGLPLGLMIVKPHLTAGVGLLTLLDRRWKALGLAAAAAFALLAMATIAYGHEIWSAFFGGVRQAGEFLSLGYYPLFRMTSWYAFVRSFDLPAGLALAMQGVSALGGLALLVLVWRARARPRTAGAAACIASLLFSPYSYDYDATILGIAAALVISDIVRLARPAEMFALVALCWWTSGYGFLANTILEGQESSIVTALGEQKIPSLAAPALLALIVLVTIILRRGARENASIAGTDAATSRG